MPVYLLHGFRWPRAGFTGIRVFVVLHNLEDAAAEYIQQPLTERLILDAFRKHEKEIMARMDAATSESATAAASEGDPAQLRLIEQYDPNDLQSSTAVSQPFAYVADKVITLGDRDGGDGAASAEAGIATSCIGLDIEQVMAAGSGMSEEAAKAFADLRDKYAAGEKIGWYLVYNGDPERSFPADDEEEEGDEGEQVYADEAGEDEDEGVGLYEDDEAGKRGKSAGGRRKREHLSANPDAQIPSRPTTSRGISGKLSRLFSKKRSDSVTS